MNMEEQNLDKAIREKLDGFSQQPPLHVWDSIQGQLRAQKRKYRIVLFSRIAAAAVIVLAFLAGWYFSDKSGEIIPAVSQTERQSQESAESNENEAFTPNVGNEGVISNKESETSVVEIQNNTQIRGTQKENNDNKSIISDNETGNLVADVKSQQSISSEDFSESENRETNRVNFLDKIEAFFTKNEGKNPALEQKSIPAKKISEDDKVLIAENIRNLQSSESEETKWKVGVQVSPGYSSQNSNYSEAYSNSMTYSGGSGNTNVTGGISVQMKAGKRWSIESGVYYSQNGQRSTNSTGFGFLSMDNAYAPLSDAERSYFNTAVNLANGQMAMNSTAGVIQFSKTPVGAEVGASLEDAMVSAPGSNTLLTDGEFSQVFEFIEVPLYLRYALIDARFGIDILGGVNAGIVAGNNVYMDNQYGNQNIGKTKDISTVNVSGTVGVGLNYALSKNVSVAVEPRLSYYLNSINQNSDVNFRPYRIGVYTGLYYEF